LESCSEPKPNSRFKAIPTQCSDQTSHSFVLIAFHQASSLKSSGQCRQTSWWKCFRRAIRGLKSAWIIHLKKREVRIYHPKRETQIFPETAELTDELLPEFRFPLSRIFDPRK
jgi:hypothetical protein